MSSSLDDMTIDQAVQYLQGKGVLDSGDANVNGELLRQQLAKVAFRGVYSIKGRSVPSTVPSDNYPTIYTDLTDRSAYYYQAARALLYLEYGDGITPFDRNRFEFEPDKSIARVDVLKVLMETFNIQPDASITNPFPNDANVSGMKSAGNFKYGYIAKAADIGIVKKPSNGQNTEFRPYAYCTRGEVFIMLARIMKKVDAGAITDPNPQKGDYFEPLNTTLQTIALGLGLPLGNFSHYTKTSFSIAGTVPLTFAHTYNSYNTTLPEVFYGINDNGETYQPLGEGWSHNFHSFITVPTGLTGSNTRVAVHWGGGSIDIYKSNGSKFVPESYGVYDEFSIEGKEIIIKTKSQMEYHFSAQGGSGSGGMICYLSSIKDRNGNTMTINYESGVKDMKRISSVSDGNRQLTFSYRSGTDLVSKISDPLGRSISFSYETNRATGGYRLCRFTDANGNSTKYSYEDNSKVSTSKLLTKIQLPKGNYIENEYDANRRLKNTVSGIGGVPTTQTSVTVAASYGGTPFTSSHMEVTHNGSQTSSYDYTYNANNVVTRITGEEGLHVDNMYGNSTHPQLPTAVKNDRTNVSNIIYDEKGNVLSMSITGDGTLTTTMTYDSMNNLTSVTDPKGNRTTYTYDSRGNLTNISAPEGVTSSISVDSKGLPTEITNAMGVRTQFEYNNYGNLIKTTLPALGLSTTATYDRASRIKSSTDALNRTTEFEYDDNDNLTSTTDSDNRTTSFDYDANDNMTRITNAKGGVTSMSYDNATDWLTSVSFAGATKEFDYNDDGSIKTFTKPDGTTLRYSYDELGRVTNDGINNYSYDSKMRLSSISGNGKTLSFSYDGFNRITRTNCDGHSNSYTYDYNGNCTSINNTSYTYDGLNRLTAV
ncbi:MAG: RHS repeat protein, partial [Bacteroidaceae bacterium]|nr:RHS repeat protein [Bacteroidaceae bacterium]